MYALNLFVLTSVLNEGNALLCTQAIAPDTGTNLLIIRQMCCIRWLRMTRSSNRTFYYALRDEILSSLRLQNVQQEQQYKLGNDHGGRE